MRVVRKRKPVPEVINRQVEQFSARMELNRRANIGASPFPKFASHAEREQYWLDQEREKYGVLKLRKPLSQMPA